jgi:hypothetical protein
LEEIETPKAAQGQPHILLFSEANPKAYDPAFGITRYICLSKSQWVDFHPQTFIHHLSWLLQKANLLIVSNGITRLGFHNFMVCFEANIILRIGWICAGTSVWYPC